MGEEIETQDQPSVPTIRDRMFGWFFPRHAARLQEMEDELYDKTRELSNQLENTTLKLQRSRQQLRSLMKDVGQYKDRWRHLAVGDYNPEEIELTEYKKMLNYDSQVIAGFELIQTGVLMKPWKIIHPDREITAVLTTALGKMRYPDIRSSMKEMMKAIAYGYSVTELVFEDYKGKYWMPRERNGLKTFDPESITFYSDEFGNLKKIEQKVVGSLISLPLDRSIVWTHEREWGNWYGKSILRGCYKNWYIKDAMMKFANIAYERFGSPILLGVAKTIQDMVNIQDAITHLYARSQGVIRVADDKDPTDIKVIESKRTEMPFDRYIRYHDEMILRRMLIGQRIFEGGGGTYGPKVPLDIIFMRLEDFRNELTDAMNEIIRMVTDLNWIVEVYPKLEFAPLTTLDQAQIQRAIFDAIDREIIERDEPWIRPHLGYPPKTEEEPETKEKREKEDQEPGAEKGKVKEEP